MFPLHVTLIGLSDQLVPRVRQELAGASAVVDGEYRGADSALEALRGITDAKHLLIVHFERLEDALWLRQLVEALGNWPILALVEVAENSDHLIAANRAGAAQVVALPLQANDFQAALDCLAQQYGPRAQNCQLIAVTGTAAGCGATTVGINAGFQIAARYGRQTVLVELGQQVGVLASYLDVEPACTLAELLGEKEHLDAQLVADSLVPVADNFRILAGTRTVGDAAVTTVPAVRRVLDFVKRQADVVLLDVPCTYDDFQFEILGAASQVVLVAEQSIASIRSLKLILDTVNTGTTGHTFFIVLNRYNETLDGLTARGLEKSLGFPQVWTIPDERSAVLAAINQGKALAAVAPHSRVLAAVDALVDGLVGAPERPREAAGSGLFRRLLHAFKRE